MAGRRESRLEPMSAESEVRVNQKPSLAHNDMPWLAVSRRTNHRDRRVLSDVNHRHHHGSLTGRRADMPSATADAIHAPTLRATWQPNNPRRNKLMVFAVRYDQRRGGIAEVLAESVIAKGAGRRGPPRPLACLPDQPCIDRLQPHRLPRGRRNVPARGQSRGPVSCFLSERHRRDRCARSGATADCADTVKMRDVLRH